MKHSTHRLIAKSVGVVLIAVVISAITRLTYQINSFDPHPCGQSRAVVYNDTEREIRVMGIALQEDESVLDVEVVLAPNQSSEEAGMCHAYEMTTRGTKDWFYKGNVLRPGNWMAISTRYTYCISGEEESTGRWYDVLCTKEPAGTE